VSLSLFALFALARLAACGKNRCQDCSKNTVAAFIEE
jgi:hypothetical protein